VVFVCSGFAAALYKVALGSHLAAFNATEQTPTDNVKWGIWDGGYWTQDNCPVGLWTPTAGTGTVWCVVLRARARVYMCVCVMPFPCAFSLFSLYRPSPPPPTFHYQPNNGSRAYALGWLQHHTPLRFPERPLWQSVAKVRTLRGAGWRHGVCMLNMLLLGGRREEEGGNKS
jgi:hypothetical protein